ncbi:hypothetical protein P22_0866 [Propionispora sp. 2/2-37]|uniref:5-deoxy-glucuronate isomerase n=1 Tax=Propionispora sp. 2/2-37 TaxID=1677858 RepID=UPI0006BB77E3|nr:5-deoxy-glucuronate isomerase [Propionispora sp. 2/2-37]CUH94800.1 hypothetical protein P22_0866 [Propionispora sp. 2/2-37]
MIGYLNKIQGGYNQITERYNKQQNMLMDIGLCSWKEGEQAALLDEKQETAFLLLNGKLAIRWEGKEQIMERHSLFDESPWCLHVPRNTKVEVKAIGACEVIVQKTDNPRMFASKLYKPEDCDSAQFGKGVWNETASRIVRTVFDYSNAPYSNLVIGEVINYPGRWSSYIPHHHPQPEVYFYRFDKPQGFGCSIIGEDIFKIKHNSFSMIPGGLVHPQVTAPGYAMYYCWMIRHLDNNPWTERVNEAAHTWLLEKDPPIWSPKE